MSRPGLRCQLVFVTLSAYIEAGLKAGTKPAETAMQSRVTYNWLIGARTDSLFFFLPLLFGFAVILALMQTDVSSSACLTFLALQGLGLGPFHMGMTWAHFKDSETNQHLVGTREQKLKALATTALIMVFCIVGMFANSSVVTAVFLATTIHHIVKQNSGILRLYHNSGESIPPRQIEEKTLNLSAWLCALIFLARNSSVINMQYLLYAAALVVLTLFIFSAREYLDQLFSRANSENQVNIPALLFWLLSVLFFLPFSFITNDYNHFLVAPLVMHWFQYVVINFVLIKRREDATGASSINIGNFLILSAMFMIFIISTGAWVVTYANVESPLFKAFTGFLIALTLIHYVQDAVLWRFRDPVLKKMIIPYLKLQQERI